MKTMEVILRGRKHTHRQAVKTTVSASGHWWDELAALKPPGSKLASFPAY